MKRFRFVNYRCKFKKRRAITTNLDVKSQHGLRGYPEILPHRERSTLSYLEPPKSHIGHCSQPHIKKILQVRASRAVAPRLPRSPARPCGLVPYLPVHSRPHSECVSTLLAGSLASVEEFPILSYPIVACIFPQSPYSYSLGSVQLQLQQGPLSTTRLQLQQGPLSTTR